MSDGRTLRTKGGFFDDSQIEIGPTLRIYASGERDFSIPSRGLLQVLAGLGLLNDCARLRFLCFRLPV